MSVDNPDTDFDRHLRGCEGAEEDCGKLALQRRREGVTGEPEPAGRHHDPRHQDVDWIGTAQQGGGHVPEDYEWTTNPRHDRLVGRRGN
jgi:hypothetical protein